MTEINDQFLDRIRSELSDKTLAKIKELISQQKYSEADTLLSFFLLRHPDNTEALELKSKIQKQDSVTSITEIKEKIFEYIKTKFPDEIDIFAMVWRLFNDVAIDDFDKAAMSGSLGFAGKEPSDIFSPKIIVFINTVLTIDTMDEKLLSEYANKLGISEETVKEIIDLIQ